MKHSGEWRVNVTQIRNAAGRAMDGTDALQLSAGEVEGRRQVRDFFAFLRAEMPGFENAYLLEIAPQVGIRETRRVRGHCGATRRRRARLRQLRRQHRRQCLAAGAARGRRREVELAGRPHSRGFNQLPWRMLLPQRVDNLLVAGRCASMNSVAQSAARVSGGCFVMGQAAGLGAALALRAGRDACRYRRGRHCRPHWSNKAPGWAATSNEHTTNNRPNGSLARGARRDRPARRTHRARCWPSAAATCWPPRASSAAPTRCARRSASSRWSSACAPGRRSTARCPRWWSASTAKMIEAFTDAELRHWQRR